MRHHNHNRKFGRTRKGRTALLRSLAVSLVLHENIKTTEARAKELRPFVEKLITHSRTDSVANRRLVNGKLGNAPVTTKKLFSSIGPRYQERQGGYTRVIKLGRRLGDGAAMAYIGLV